MFCVNYPLRNRCRIEVSSGSLGGMMPTKSKGRAMICNKNSTSANGMFVNYL